MFALPVLQLSDCVGLSWVCVGDVGLCLSSSCRQGALVICLPGGFVANMLQRGTMGRLGWWVVGLVFTSLF
jgi:hypothetical protein